MKTLFGLFVLLLLGAGVWIVTESQKPELLAKIEIEKEIVAITNGNDRAWPTALIILNDPFDGPRANIGRLEPGKRIELPLNKFVGLFNQQAFNPEFQRVREVSIKVDGFQVGIFKR